MSVREGRPLLVIARREVAALLHPGELVEVIEAALCAQARGACAGPVSVGISAARWAPGAAFHAKGAGIDEGSGGRAGFKVNANYPDNARRGGPTVQGLIALFDARDGAPVAVMDSVEITALRTAGASAAAARRLAPNGSRIATIVGCGVQGWAHARALCSVLPRLELRLHDVEPARAAALAARVRAELGREARACARLEAAVRESDVVATCTTARAPFLASAWVRDGAFVAAVGADSEGKRELEPELLARARVVVDDLAACAAAGELRGALDAGLLAPEDVAARLADVIAGAVKVRRCEDDVVVFDSTGIAIEDVAAADLVYRRALERGVGQRVDLAAP